MEWEQVLSEKKGKPEKPKKAAQKRKQSLKKNQDLDWKKDVEPKVKALKGKKDVDNPYALSVWAAKAEKGHEPEATEKKKASQKGGRKGGRKS